MDDSKSDKQTVEMTEVFTKQEVAFDYYSCEEAITRLNDFLDHELSPEEKATVKKHLEICEPCLERFTFEQSLIQSFRTKVQATCCPNALKSKLSALIKGASKQ